MAVCIIIFTAAQETSMMWLHAGSYINYIARSVCVVVYTLQNKHSKFNVKVATQS